MAEEEKVEETIRNLLFRAEPEEARKVPRHISRYSQEVVHALKSSKECHRTFGLPNELLVPKPLKKGQGVQRPSQSAKERERSSCREGRKPPLPARSKISPLATDHRSQEQKDFIRRNIASASRSRPSQGSTRDFDTALARRVRSSTLTEPLFVLSADFGRTPRYLERRLAEVADRRRKEEEAMAQKEEDVMPGVQVIPPEQREQLIRGLRESWERLTTEYQLLPLVVDTRATISKKRALEENLDKIERYLSLLERNTHIAVKTKLSTYKNFARETVS